MRSFLAALLVVCAVLSMTSAIAFEIDQPLDDPALELRARELSRSFRCLVCQNQSIFDSDASLAVDLRRIVRERIVAGDSDAQIEQFLVTRYGDFVLLKPPLKPKTYLLWFGPLLIAVLAVAGVFAYFRGQRARAASLAPLSADERARLDALLGDESDT
jgi:cytochrome c-type biogenesis protein CcmH